MRAAEIDRASKLRQFWSITLPMVLPFLMLAILFRAIENFKMFDMVVELTSGGPGSTTELASITLKREAFEKWKTRLQLGLCDHTLCHGLWRRIEHLCQGDERGQKTGERPRAAKARFCGALPPCLVHRIRAGHAYPDGVDFHDWLQDAAGLDRLSAQGGV